MDRLRWQCESSDDIHKTWTRNNLESYGSQDIQDPQSNLILTTEYYKKPSGDKGGDWSIRISGKSKNKNEEQISLFFLFEGDNFKLANMRNNGLTSPILINGASKTIGKHSIYITDQSGYKGESFSKLDQILEKFHFVGTKNSFSKDLLFESLRRKSDKDSKVNIFTLNNSVQDGSGTLVVQKIMTTPFSFDISLLSHDVHPDTSSHKKEVANLTGKKLTDLFVAEKKAFDQKFGEVFKVSTNTNFAQSALSNLIGGIGYFTGSSIHQYGNSQPKMTPPNRSLLTATPSRTFFPRGFLWDEGFHLTLIKKWNPDLFKDILTHWLNLMDPDGWIAREQILGEEAQSKVPQEFQKQVNDIANPPTIFIPILSLLEDIKSTVSIGMDGQVVQLASPDLDFLRSIYPKLKLFYNWYHKTQNGLLQGTFQWRGRSKGHTFASGLDDYPRGVGTPQRTERHLDLYCWMYFLSDSMKQITQVLQIRDDSFEKNMKQLTDNFDKWHWNQKLQMHSDYVGPIKIHPNFTRAEFSPHVGYISLFPLITDIISPESDSYERLIDIMSDPKQLFTSYGLRSLSASDKLFGTKENYWRGPIWININYLVLRALHRYVGKSQHTISERHVKVKEFYTKLRNNVVQTVINNWKKHGSFYEQYNPSTGAGQRLSDFSGWTTLSLLIMTENY